METLRIATWNQDYWRRTPAQRDAAWQHLDQLKVDAALLQESVPPAHLGRDRLLWREIGGSRRWGSAERVDGRPTISISSLARAESLKVFLGIFEDLVRRTREEETADV